VAGVDQALSFATAIPYELALDRCEYLLEAELANHEAASHAYMQAF
jgi:hypothetical protein